MRSLFAGSIRSVVRRDRPCQDEYRRLIDDVAGGRIVTPEEIAALPGFSTRLAARILEHLPS